MARFPMLCPLSLMVAMLIILLPMQQDNGVVLVLSQTQTDNCMSKLLPLKPCMPYVLPDNYATPKDSCCTALKTIATSEDSDCLCLLKQLAESQNISLNATRALQITQECNVGNLTENVISCLGLGPAALPNFKPDQVAPASPPEFVPFQSFAPGSDVTASPPGFDVTASPPELAGPNFKPDQDAPASPPEFVPFQSFAPDSDVTASPPGFDVAASPPELAGPNFKPDQVAPASPPEFVPFQSSAPGFDVTASPPGFDLTASPPEFAFDLSSASILMRGWNMFLAIVMLLQVGTCYKMW